MLVARQIDRGGPVILVQVENEYGAYGCDQDYLRELADLIRACGITAALTTVDQPAGDMLADGSLPGVLATGSFGGHVAQRLAALRAHRSDGPLMCSEFWDGWFDHWGGHHHVTPPVEADAVRAWPGHQGERQRTDRPRAERGERDRGLPAGPRPRPHRALRRLRS